LGRHKTKERGETFGEGAEHLRNILKTEKEKSGHWDSVDGSVGKWQGPDTPNLVRGQKQ